MSEELLDRVASLFVVASGGSSRGNERTVARRIIEAGLEASSADAFVEEAARFAAGFKKTSFMEMKDVFRLIKAETSEVATTVAGSQSSEFDRAFYDENGAAETQESFLGDEKKWAEREEKMRRNGAQIGRSKLSQSFEARLHRAKREEDQSAWEEQRLFRSGVKRGRSFNTDLQTDTEERLAVLVRNVQPKFLEEGDLIFSLQSAPESAQVVKDEKSSMAIVAEKGSESLTKLREQQVRTKMKHKFWELGGSKMGNAIGIDAEADYGQSQEEAEKYDLDKVAKEEESSSTKMKISSRKEIAKVREALPIRKVRDDLLSVVRSNQVIVIVGETGSGKTTQLTQYLREDGYTKGSDGQRQVVACTQPRRVAAMSVAKRVADEVGCPLGVEVGYSIRFEDCTTGATEIKYMTDGVLMRETLSNPDLDRYSCVVMDEAHERSLFTDVLFGILKGIVQRRLDFKLIVTSATMDAEKFSRFFGGCATFHIPGRIFKVNTYFSKTPINDYVKGAVKQALEIHLSCPPGDILIFMTGQEDINATCHLLAEKVESLSDGVPELLLLPMYSQLPADLQGKIFDKAKSGQRKCIVSTNIAETSLTVDGIRYVIDTGFCKLKVFNAKIGMDSLRITPVSQANANQRSGRAGRTAEGHCWRLYTENQFVHELLPAQVPEIQRTNLGNVVLLLKSLGVRDLLEFDFMDPPPRDNIVNSMYQLWVLGALDDTGDLTKLGKDMGKYPLDPALSKMLITANILNCTDDMLTVVSMLSVPEVFYRPAERAEESDQARERFFVPESDHLTLLNVFNLAKRQNFSPGWCAKYFIQLKSLSKAREVREQLATMVPKNAIASSQSGSITSRWDQVRKSICSAYFVHAARLKSVTEYTNLLNGTPANLHPSSAICGIGETPDYVVYHELVLTSREYMRIVTAIDPIWLAELGPMFFSIRGMEVTPSQDLANFQEAGKARHREKNSAEFNKERRRGAGHEENDDDEEEQPVLKRPTHSKTAGGLLKRSSSKKKKRFGL